MSNTSLPNNLKIDDVKSCLFGMADKYLRGAAIYDTGEELYKGGYIAITEVMKLFGWYEEYKAEIDTPINM